MYLGGRSLTRAVCGPEEYLHLKQELQFVRNIHVVGLI